MTSLTSFASIPSLALIHILHTVPMRSTNRGPCRGWCEWPSNHTHIRSYLIIRGFDPTWLFHFCLDQVHFFSPSAASTSLFPYSSKNPTFKEVLTRIEGHPDCRNLPMISFLILPMQRITRLPLLMDVSALKTYSRASLGITRLPLAQQFVYLRCPC